jgi:hypothetical protein
MRAQRRARRSLRWIVLATLAAAMMAHEVRADEPDPLFAAVQAAVAAGKTHSSAVKGFHDPKGTFIELPAGKVLIGFDCGIGTFLDLDTVYALRAIYRTADGVSFGRAHGLFVDQQLGPKATVKTRVLRTVRLQAPPGYAVGAVTIRTGLNINGLALTFLKIDGLRLDPRHAIASPWVGDRTGGSESFIGGDGAIVVGIFGSKEETLVQSLGLITLDLLPAIPKAAQAGDADAVEDAPAEEPHKPAAKGNGRSRNKSWLSYAAFGAFALAALIASLAFLNTRKRPARRRERRVDEETQSTPRDMGVECAPTVLVPSDAIQAGAPRLSLLSARFESRATSLESRGVMLCGRCSRSIPAETGRPWCPHCGGDLKPAAMVASGDPGAAAMVPPRLMQPPYFVGRLGGSYRIYITPAQLLFLQCPGCDDRGPEKQDCVAMQNRQWTLDMAGERDLTEMTERERGSFALDHADLRGLRI